MDRYVIFSTERLQWWGPNSMGYSPDIRKAGLYTYDEAMAICQNANQNKEIGESLEELMLPAPIAFQLCSKGTK